MHQNQLIPPRLATWFLVLVVIAGCATPYQSERGFGLLKLEGGFIERRIRPNMWDIRFKGNSRLPQEKARDFCLLRASELCLQNGFTHFIIVEELLDEKRTSRRLPSITSTRGDTSGRASNNTMRGGTADSVSKAYLIRIECSNESGADSFNAVSLKTSITNKY